MASSGVITCPGCGKQYNADVLPKCPVCRSTTGLATPDALGTPLGVVKCNECGELTLAADGPLCRSCQQRQSEPKISSDGLWRFTGDEWVATEKQHRLLLELQLTQTNYLRSIKGSVGFMAVILAISIIVTFINILVVSSGKQ